MNTKKTTSGTRCAWLNNDSIYIAYHDNEWGIAEYNSQKLFEKICLEGQQAGLSWITVLKKRQAYRDCFHQFDTQKIALMTQEDVDKLVQNPQIIRHRGKIEAIINNAKAYLKMQQQGEDFSQFVWSFVGGETIINHFTTLSDVPPKTEQSDALANALKKRGFKFVGSTTCYAFMQSMGLVNDHTTDCVCHPNNHQ